MCDHDLDYYETYQPTDSLSLVEMIESDMREENHSLDSNEDNNVNNNWSLHCTHTSDASIDFDTSGLLVDPQTGVPVLSIDSNPSVLQSAYILVNPDMMDSTPNNEIDGGKKVQSRRTRCESSSSASTSSTSSSEDEDTTADDGDLEILKEEHSLDQTSSPLFSTDKYYPKPIYSYSCLIAMALKNSETGCLPVSEIYNFMIRNYPYFKTAPNGWKNSVRHNLSLNKCFAKVPDKSSGKQRKGCLWTMNPDRIEKMDDEVFKWSQKDPAGIKQSMAKPEDFGVLEKFCDKHEKQMEDIRLELVNPTVIHYQSITPSEFEAKQSTDDPTPQHIQAKEEESESEINLDNSLLDSTYHVDFWGELEEKLEFDIPLTMENQLATSCTQSSRSTVKIKL